jgi:hypothetical protein
MRRSPFVLVLVLVTASCYNDWRDDYDFEWHGEHVSVYGYGYTEDDICGGSLAELDGQVAMIKAELGIVDAPPSIVRWLADDFAADLTETCGTGVSACEVLGEALAPTLPHMHEVTHTITADGCPRLLSEGLSMYFDGAVATDWPTWEESMTLREAMELGFEWSGSFYIHGMRLVSYLAETYGLGAVMELCEGLAEQPTVEQWDIAARETLGVPLEQLLADYNDYPQCTYSQMRAKLWGCQRPADIQLYTEGQSYTIESDCNDPQATNAGGGPGDAVLRRLLFVPWDMVIDVGVYALPDGQGPEPAYVITECAACSENPGVFVDVTADPLYGYNLHTLRAGYYEVTVFFDRRDRVALRLSVFAVHEL